MKLFPSKRTGTESIVFDSFAVSIVIIIIVVVVGVVVVAAVTYCIIVVTDVLITVVEFA